MNPVQSIRAFLDKQSRAAPSNILRTSCERWVYYYHFLQIIHARFAEERAAYSIEMQKYEAHFKADTGPDPWTPTLADDQLSS